MRGFLSKAQASLERVETIRAGIGDNWRGVTAEAYQHEHGEWLRDAQDMAKAVDDFSAWIKRARDAYAAAMDANVNMTVS